jgi:hypothetical protein
MISPNDDTLHRSAGAVADPVPTRLPSRQRSARTDPAMRDGDSSHGNPYESGPTTFGEFGSDVDVGDAVPEGVSAADVIPVEPGAPEARGPRAVTLPNAEAAVVPTADMTSTGAARTAADDEDDGDEATVLAEEETGGWNHAAAAEADREDRSDENNRAIRAEPIRAAKPGRNGRRAGRKDDDIPVRRDDDLPIEGYRDLTVPEIIERVMAMPVRQAREVQRYEGSHRRRKTLLVKLERYLRDKRDEPAAAGVA